MKSHHRRLVFAVVVSFALALGYRALAVSIVPKDLTTPGITPTLLANALVGAGVTISNVTFKGDARAAGIFTGGSASIGLEGGVVLSTGRIRDVVGPNTSDSTQTDLGAPADAVPRAQQNGCADPAHQGKLTLGLPGDTDLNALSGFTTCDSTVLEFDFVPDKDRVFLQYVFASEEYNEFVNTPFNDVFGFFVNGVNCATVDPAHRVPVSINTINGGGPDFLGQAPVSRPDLYINNDFHPTAPRDTQMDGMTVVLTCQAPVSPNITNHMKLAIADASDPFYDSNVFLQATSLTTTPPLTIVKTTNGTDNDAAPGTFILIPPGATVPVTWTYRVSNNSITAITNVQVTDDKQGAICTIPSLAVGTSTTCSKTATAVPGQYSNIGTVTGLSPLIGLVTDHNPDNYFGAQPSIAIVKKTNDTNNDAAPGPLVLVGSPVTWSYEITNTGNVTLTGVAVSDSDPSLAVSCPTTTLQAGSVMICLATAPATAGQYANTGTVTARAPVGPPVTATDVDHYFGADPKIAIVKRTNGTNNNSAPGPLILAGDPVTWTYAVTNTGNVSLANVAVVDDQGVAVGCPSTTLAVGAVLTCSGTGVARKGQYENTGTASGRFGPVSVNGGINTVTVSASDVDHYFGAAPSVALVKQTNGTNNDAAPGPLVLVGDPVTWTYQVTNTGNVPLPSVAVTDDRVGSICTVGPLAAGATTSCTKTGTAQKGQYENTGTATANVDTVTEVGQTKTSVVKASDVDHYFGAQPNVAIVKQTNGTNNDSAPGPLVLVGDPVTWTYALTNTGNVPLPSVVVTDDRIGAICTVGPLAVGATASCTKTGTALKGQYENTGTASASVDIATQAGQTKTVPVKASDIDHYFGVDPKLTIVKLTNGTNNNSAPGPSVLAGEPVTWTYVVTNTGNVALPNVAVTDDRAGAICAIGPLAIGASTTCTKTGSALKGQYENTGTANASVDTVTNIGQAKTVAVTASDIDHYFGAAPSVAIVKRTFDSDNDLPPGPIVLVGLPARWSYTVTNTGNVPLVNVAVTDDKEGPVCTIAALAVGQTAPACAKTGIVALGQYENTGVASGTFGPVFVGGKIDSVAVTASNIDHYFGGRPGIAIVKKTNGTDNDAPPGPAILAGKTVTWTYTVTNTGNLPLTNVAVADDKLGAVTCPATTLPPAPDPASTMQCSAGGKAVEGQYENTGTATGSSALGPVVARNVDHYFGVNSGTFFVVGDAEPHDVGDAVNFWGAQWWKNNQMSGLVTPGVASFKGYALDVDVSGPTMPGCGGTWSTRPGNSPPPPDTIPTFVAIIVTDSVAKSGPVINGTIREILVVHQDGGYSSNPGHRGNGPVVAVVCKQP